jgi:carbamoyl-phosphate synthase large subunit
MKVLVSGVAGDIGFGVGRILKNWGIFDRMYGIDISDDHPASIIFDKINIAPRADDSNYLDWISDYISDNKIDIFIPTSEAEILVVSSEICRLHEQCKVLINDAFLVRKCLDKHDTLSFLSANGIAVPSNGLVGEGDMPSRYPIITKPRTGQGSKGFQKVSSLSMLEGSPSGYVWQDYLTPDNQEYTCAVYVTKELSTRVLVFKRLLVGGYTGKGSVVCIPEINEYVEKIAEVFKKPGCFNIQLRLTDEGPKLFEINPRLSSTLVFRDKLGFHDLRWWLSECVNIKLPAYKAVPEGIKIYRGNFEYIIQPDQ